MWAPSARMAADEEAVVSDADGFDNSGDYDGDPAPRSEGSGLRRQLESALQAKAELENRLKTEVPEAEQRGEQAAQRRFQARETFGGLGFPNLGDLWVKEHPEGELNPDAATEFLTGLGIQPIKSDEQAAEAQISDEVRKAAQAFTRPVSASQAGQTYERSEIEQMMLDPARRDEALRASREGRVKLNNPRASQVEVRDNAGLFRQ